MQFFVVSETCFVVTNLCGIWLYYIPDFGAVGEDTGLAPVWNRLLDASYFRGTIRRVGSLHPAAWLEGEQTTHRLRPNVDEPGCYPMALNHRITER